MWASQRGLLRVRERETANEGMRDEEFNRMVSTGMKREGYRHGEVKRREGCQRERETRLMGRR